MLWIWNCKQGREYFRLTKKTKDAIVDEVAKIQLSRWKEIAGEIGIFTSRAGTMGVL